MKLLINPVVEPGADSPLSGLCTMFTNNCERGVSNLKNLLLNIALLTWCYELVVGLLHLHHSSIRPTRHIRGWGEGRGRGAKGRGERSFRRCCAAFEATKLFNLLLINANRRELRIFVSRAEVFWAYLQHSLRQFSKSPPCVCYWVYFERG